MTQELQLGKIYEDRFPSYFQKRFIIGDTETGTAFDDADTRSEAIVAVKEMEAEDIANGTYAEYYYSIFDRETQEWEKV
jgi:hypothetical protein